MSSKKYKGKGERRLSPFLDVPEEWERHWQDMPEFVQKDLSPFKSIIVHFKDKKDMIDFMDIIKQKFNLETQSIWFPQAKIDSYKDKIYIDES